MSDRIETKLPEGAVDQPRRVRLRWRKGKLRSGMMRLPQTYSLYRGDKKLATCQGTGQGEWFWYAAGKNTATMPTDLQTAKRAAKAYVLANA